MTKQLIALSSKEEVSMADEWFEISTAEHFWMVWRLAVINQAVESAVKVSSSMKFLEIGCGHGVFLNQFEKTFDCPIDGCDLNVHALNKVSSSVKGEVYIYNILQPKSEMLQKYNGVFLLDVIEHITDDKGFLKASVQHLLDGGFVVVNVPALTALFSQYDTVAGHKRRYKRKDIEILFKDCDLEPIYVSYWGFLLLPVALLRKLILKFIDPAQVINTGFNPGSPFINGLFKLAMKIELSLMKKPFLGTSIIGIGRKKSYENIKS